MTGDGEIAWLRVLLLILADGQPQNISRHGGRPQLSIV